VYKKTTVQIASAASKASVDKVDTSYKLVPVDHVECQIFCLSSCTMTSLISCVSWVRRGVSAQHPSKYVLDDRELTRVSALARIELEDARVELERAHEAAKSMGRGAGDDEADDESDWVE
jgi:hypothetical protein